MNRLRQSLEPFHIPTSCRQPRSQGSRPRHPRGWKEGSAGATTSSSGDIIQGEEAVQWGAGFLNGGPEGAILQPADVESAAVNPLLATCNKGFLGQDAKDRHLSNDAAEVLGSHLSPGSVVWAKTDYHECWPAEVMDGRTILDCGENQSGGLVLIQLYGIYEYAWVDPVSSLSQFDHCYEERSKDPSRAFQDALNQALRQKETASSSEQSDENSDKWNPKRRFRAEEDEECRGKGKRARKPKLHFDDLEFPENSARKLRRMKIMRHLGLVAPAGSPFNRAHGSRRA